MSGRAVFYAQSGGATSVINATATGAILAARKAGYPFYVGRNGICGALAEELFDTTKESLADIEALAFTPGCAFGSCRLKLPSFQENPTVFRRIFDVFEAHDVGACLYNGGGDSQDTGLKLAEASLALQYPLKVIGLPKTIDNDLYGTDCSPGYGSAAKYIASSVREIYNDLSGMAPTSTKLFFLEVMGRNSGWLALAGGLAHEPEGKLPVILLLPEQDWSFETCANRAKQLIAQHGCAVVVVAEGMSTKFAKDVIFDNSSGQLGSQADVFGNRRLSGAAPFLAEAFRNKLHYKVQWAVAGYLQRAAAHLASAVDREQALAVGARAIELVAAGQSGVMVTIERLSSQPYQWKLGSIALSEVANRVVQVPSVFWDPQTYDISAKGLEYLAPLAAGEAVLSVDSSGLPRMVKLKKFLMPKLLPEVDWLGWFKA